MTPMERIDGMNLAWCSGALGRRPLRCGKRARDRDKDKSGVETTGAAQGKKELGAEGKNPESIMKVGKRGGRALSVAKETAPMNRAYSESGNGGSRGQGDRCGVETVSMLPLYCSFHDRRG